MGVTIAFGIDVSLPAFDELRDHFDLAAGSGEVSLVVTFYFLGMAAGQVVYGPFADRFGRLPVLTVAFSIYLVGAAGSTLATSMEMLLGARLVWGFGAAAGAVLWAAIARDLYDGDRMARVLTLVTAVFLIGPMLVPAFGELLLLTGSWRTVFGFGILLALAAIAWGHRFGETLLPEHRRSLEIGETGAAFRALFTSRNALGHLIGVTFAEAAFFIYLGSGQPIIDEIYGHGDWFALIFGAVAIVIAIVLLGASRITTRFGAIRTVTVASGAVVAFSGLLLIASLASDGRPSFGLWFAIVAPALAAMVVVTPTAMSLALQPMERMAGTAAAVIGLCSFGGGASLAALVDRRIEASVTPMAIGFLVYGTVSAIGIHWAVRSGAPAAPPVAAGYDPAPEA